MLILLVLGLGAAALLSGGPSSAGKANKADLEKYVLSCELDPSLSPEAQAGVRLKMSSAVQGFTKPEELYQYGNDLEAAGYPKAGFCAKQLAVGLQAKS